MFQHNALNDHQIEKIIAAHGVMMKRFGYLDEYNQLVDFEFIRCYAVYRRKCPEEHMIKTLL